MKKVIRINNKAYRVGEENYNNQNCLMKIITYNHCDNIIIEFQDKYKAKINTRYKHFKNGGIKNPYFPNLKGIGYLGEGKYQSKINYKLTNQYLIWMEIIIRSYDENFHKKHPTYKDCTVCEEWHNFQNFAKWYDENYYKIPGEKMQIDKDILIKGNKIYSPDTCVFVPQRINALFIKSQNSRGKYPIGVTYHKKKYDSRVTINYKTLHLGSYSTPEEAFQAYKVAKENHIKQVADEYKSKYPQFPKKLYDAMYSYKVEIDD